MKKGPSYSAFAAALILLCSACGSQPKRLVATPTEQDPAAEVSEDPSGEAPAGPSENPASPSEDVKPADFVPGPVQLTPRRAGVMPMTGIVVWADNDKACTKPWVTMEFSYFKYSDVCSEKDRFDWSPVEKFLDGVASRGHQGVVRFWYSYVGKSSGVPAYIKKLSGYETTWGKSEDENTEFPDWRCDELERFHMEFHRAFAQKYDSDPRLAFYETGFGLWAEYHIYDGPFTLGRTFPSKDFQARFLTAMADWFQSTPWCISIDAASGKYAPFRENPSLLELPFGNFDDSFMCEEHDEENYPNWLFFGAERYRRAPLGGEFSYYTPSDQKHCLDKAGMHGRTFESEAARYHLSFIIGDGQHRYQSDARLTEASSAMGYRFALRSLDVEEDGTVLAKIENTGVAPIYRDAFLGLRTSSGTLESDFNLRELLPGESRSISFTLPAATKAAEGVESSLVILCDALLPGKSIPLDIAP